jgi:cobalt-zinc-cadmium efflux system outer membrane protein
MSLRDRTTFASPIAARTSIALLVTLLVAPQVSAQEVATHSRWPRSQPTAAPRTPVARMQLRQASAQAEIVATPTANDVAGDGLSLDSLVQIALANNPTLRQASASLEAARGNWVQVGLYPNPGIGYLGNQIGDRGTAGQQGAYFEQEFVRGGKLALNRQVAEREVIIAQQTLEAQRHRVINDIRTQFYNTLVAQRTVEITRELQAMGKRGLSVADQLFNAQQVGKVDVLQARIEAANAGLKVTAAENHLEASWRQLATVSAVPGMQREKLVGDLDADLPQFTWEEAMGRILQESPELAASRTNVDRAAEALRRARVEPVSNVTVQAGPQYDIGANHAITNVSVLVPVPLFNYNQGNIRKAEADVRAARAGLLHHELILTTKLTSAFERYQNARYQVQQYRDEILPDARQALELIASAYRQGETNFLVMLNAQRTFAYTTLASLEAKRELWETGIAIDGLLLTDSLQVGTISTPAVPTALPPAGMQANPLLGH